MIGNLTDLVLIHFKKRKTIEVARMEAGGMTTRVTKLNLNIEMMVIIIIIAVLIEVMIDIIHIIAQTIIHNRIFILDIITQVIIIIIIDEHFRYLGLLFTIRICT